MNQKIKTIKINSLADVPSLDFIIGIPREQGLKLVFDTKIETQRQEVGRILKDELAGFSVGISPVHSQITISKLITDEEIEINKLFFERCAKDYRTLSTDLISRLIDQLKLSVDYEFPLMYFNPLKNTKQEWGHMDDWRYYLHGFDCGFENTKTKQKIEVPLTFGAEFGRLDPYFFSIFIKSTKEYAPLPVAIYDDFQDGTRINEKMVNLGYSKR